METRDPNQQNKTLRITSMILGLLLLLALILMIVFMVRGSRLNNEKEVLQTEKEILQTDIQRVSTERDESRQMVADLRINMENLQVSHEDEIQALNQQIVQLSPRAQQVPQLRRELEQYRMLQSEYDQLQEDHNRLRTDFEELEGHSGYLAEQVQHLRDSIDGSRELRVYNINLLTKWDRWLCADRYNVTRARRVDQTMIDFEIDGTHFSETGARTLSMNMLDPQGNLMYPSEETFTIGGTGEQSSYTQQKEIDFTGEVEHVEFTILHPERLESGLYTVEVYIDGVLTRTGRISFE